MTANEFQSTRPVARSGVRSGFTAFRSKSSRLQFPQQRLLTGSLDLAFSATQCGQHVAAAATVGVAGTLQVFASQQHTDMSGCRKQQTHPMSETTFATNDFMRSLFDRSETRSM